jgi:SatD family (SatD)
LNFTFKEYIFALNFLEELMKKIVLIADIISSRKIKERDKIQQKLKVLFNNINNNSRSILSPFTITLGDEFQCVYSKPDEMFLHVWQILDSAYPEKIRFSYGVGEISTRLNRVQSIGMDGPAFYKAREALLGAKQNNYLFNIGSSVDNSELLDYIKHSLYVISFHADGWKKNRIKIMSLLTTEMQVKEIAKKLKITEQAVYKSINNGGLLQILELAKDIEKNIGKLVRS